MAGVQVQEQHFAAITEFSEDEDLNVDFDGILGLAFPSISELVVGTPFMQTASAQGKLMWTSFDIHIPATGMELYLGECRNDDLYLKGVIDHHVVDESQGYWQLNGASAAIAGTVFASGFDTILDSGTEYINAPPDAVCPVSL